MTKILNHFTYLKHHTHPEKGLLLGEVNTLPSKTVPSMQLSLREMLERYVRGGEVEVFNPVYLDDDDIVPHNLERMDEMDRKDYAVTMKKAIKDFQEAVPLSDPEPVEVPASSRVEPTD